jgi:hydroxymethylbilane synthase
MRTIRLATRSSPLARFQAEQVASLLTRAGSERLAGKGSIGLLEVELVLIETTGDRRRDVSIGALGGQGVFVKEVEQALLDGRADVAVHSAKDLPSSYADDALAIVAVPGRADARDALVGRSLGELGPGARIATGAARRRAQLAWARPDLRFEELRGNIATRLGKVPPGGAVVVALAALQRLGLIELAAEVLPVSIVLPQAGQGALAVQCRVDDDETVVAVRLIDDERAHSCVDAERAVTCRSAPTRPGRPLTARSRSKDSSRPPTGPSCFGGAPSGPSQARSAPTWLGSCSTAAVGRSSCPAPTRAHDGLPRRSRSG